MSSQGKVKMTLRWEKFDGALTKGLGALLADNDLVDITLACQGEFVKAHKNILSVCSPFFKNLFKEVPASHPVVVVQAAKMSHIQALLQFMYSGETTVPQGELAAFLKTAQSLQIKGLCDDEENDGVALPEQENEPENAPSSCSTPPPAKRKRLSECPSTSTAPETLTPWSDKPSTSQAATEFVDMIEIKEQKEQISKKLSLLQNEGHLTIESHSATKEEFTTGIEIKDEPSSDDDSYAQYMAIQSSDITKNQQHNNLENDGSGAGDCGNTFDSVLRYPTPLPRFSLAVCALIESAEILERPTLLVQEAAFFLQKLKPYPKPSEYAAYARTLCENYPILKRLESRGKLQPLHYYKHLNELLALPPSSLVIAEELNTNIVNEPFAESIEIKDEPLNSGQLLFKIETLGSAGDLYKEHQLLELGGSTNESQPARDTGYNGSSSSNKRKRTIYYPSALPNFSLPVMHLINTSEILKRPTRLLQEAVYFLQELQSHPSPAEYAAFARTLCEKYPILRCLKPKGGVEPMHDYSVLSRAISTKMRLWRYADKRKIKSEQLPETH